MSDVIAEQHPAVVRIAVGMCTYRRNQQLRELLTTVAEIAERARNEFEIGVVMVDDDPDGGAKEVAVEFGDRFQLGMHYRATGSGNISTARNMLLNTAIEVAEFVAMIDDDCEPPIDWLEHLVATQRRTGAEMVTSRIQLVNPPNSPRWLDDQFSGIAEYVDGEEPPFGSTANALLMSAWFRNHSDVRFRTELGRTGGEDMTFYFEARRAGARLRYSAKAVISEKRPPHRATFRYQLRNEYWLANNQTVINRVTRQHSRTRFLARGAKMIVTAPVLPISRIRRGQPPHFRWALATIVRGVGLISGVFGVRRNHH